MGSSKSDESGILNEMKKLRRETAGWLLRVPPRTEEERQRTEAAGFVQQPSGQWVLPDYDFRPRLEVLRKQRYGHCCKACRSFFRSNRARDPYCPSCRSIMDEARERLEAILSAAIDATEEKQRQARFQVEEELKCPVCGWIQNEGRIVPENLRLALGYLPGWIRRAHCHFFRHAFWNRFPYNRRFARKITLAERQFIYGPNLLPDLREGITLEIVPLATVEAQPLTTVEISLLGAAPPLTAEKGDKPSNGESVIG